jgi:hypothetical protein
MGCPSWMKTTSSNGKQYLKTKYSSIIIHVHPNPLRTLKNPFLGCSSQWVLASVDGRVSEFVDTR